LRLHSECKMYCNASKMATEVHSFKVLSDIKNRKSFTLFVLLYQYRIELATWNVYITVYLLFGGVR
jgi:hypothetical protein